MNVEIRYKKIFPMFILPCGVFIIFTALIISKPFPQTISQLIPGIICTLVSLGMLSKPMLVITSGQIEIKNLLGMTVKRHTYNNGELKVTSSGIFINEKKIIGRFTCRNEDINNLNEVINETLSEE